MTPTFIPVPKPVRNTTDYQAKAIETAAKIATFDGVCRMEGCNHTRAAGYDIVAHHIVHRKYGNTCALLANLFPVCVECHGKIHHNEESFKEWLNVTSHGLYDSLWQQAREICHLDWIDVYSDLLETLYALLKAQREVKEGKQ